MIVLAPVIAMIDNGHGQSKYIVLIKVARLLRCFLAPNGAPESPHLDVMIQILVVKECS